jgi:hypothetical protein
MSTTLTILVGAMKILGMSLGWVLTLGPIETVGTTYLVGASIWVLVIIAYVILGWVLL